MTKKKDPPPPKISVPCKIGTFSPGEETASIAISFAPDAMTLDRCETFLCGKQLDAVLAMGSEAAGDTPGQETFETDLELKVVCEVGGYRRTPKAISAKLSFPISTIGDETFAPLCRAGKTEGLLTATLLGAMPEKHRGRPRADTNDPNQMELGEEEQE